MGAEFRRILGVFFTYLVLSTEGIRVRQEIGLRGKNWEAAKERGGGVLSSLNDDLDIFSRNRIAISGEAVFLELDLAEKTSQKCFGICTAIAIAIAVAAAAALAATIGHVVASNAALVKLEGVRAEVEDAKVASCVIVKQIAFETRSFEMAVQAFTSSVKIVVPPDGGKMTHVATDRDPNALTQERFLENAGLKKSSSSEENRAYLDEKLKVLIRKLDSETERVLGILDRLEQISCGGFSSEHEETLRNEIVTQHKDLKAKTKQLVLDAITFVVATVGAGLGAAASSAVGSARQVFDTAKTAVDTTVTIGMDAYETTMVVLQAVETKAHFANGDTTLAGVTFGKVMGNLAKNHMGDIASTAKAKALNAAIKIGLGLLSLGLAIKKIVDRFTQLFDSRAEYDARNTRAMVSGYLFRAEKKNAECSLVNDVRVITERQNGALSNVLEVVTERLSHEQSTGAMRVASSAPALITIICEANVQLCYRMLKDPDFGDGLQLSGAISSTVAQQLERLARTGPITDLAISTNSDEAKILRTMGYEVVTAKPLIADPHRGSRRLWSCRMCSRWPIVNLQFVTVKRRDLTKATSRKKNPVRDLSEYLIELSGKDAKGRDRVMPLSFRPEDVGNAKIEYLKLGPGDAKGLSDRYAVFVRPHTAGRHDDTTIFNVLQHVDVFSVDPSTIGGYHGYSDGIGTSIETPIFPEGGVKYFAYHFAKRLFSFDEGRTDGGVGRTRSSMKTRLHTQVHSIRGDDFERLVAKTSPFEWSEGRLFDPGLSKKESMMKMAVDQAWVSTIGWCDRERVTRSGWYPATGLPGDGRSMFFRPVSHVHKDTMGSFDSQTWGYYHKMAVIGQERSTLGDGDHDFGPYCALVQGGYMSDTLHNIGESASGRAEFDFAFTLDGKNDPLAFIGTAGWIPIALVRSDSRKGLKNFDPTWLVGAVDDTKERNPFLKSLYHETKSSDEFLTRLLAHHVANHRKPRHACGSVCRKDHVCAIDRTSEPVDTETGENMGQFFSYCKCMLPNDRDEKNKKYHESTMKRGIDVGDWVVANTCMSWEIRSMNDLGWLSEDYNRKYREKKYIWEGNDDLLVETYFDKIAVVEDIVEWGTSLPPELVKDVEKYDNPDRHLVYYALVRKGDEVRACELDKLRPAPKWNVWDPVDDSGSFCIMLDPMVALVSRPAGPHLSPPTGSVVSKDALRKMVQVTYEYARKRYRTARETFKSFLCKTEDLAAKSSALHNPKDSMYVQKSTCRFRDDPPKILASMRDQSGSGGDDDARALTKHAPLFFDWARGWYGGATTGNKYCSWAARSPRHDGLTLLDFMNWKPYRYRDFNGRAVVASDLSAAEDETPYLYDIDAGRFPLFGDGTSSEQPRKDIELRAMLKANLARKMEHAPTLSQLQERLMGIGKNPMNAELISFLEFVAHPGNCYHRSFHPVRFSAKCEFKQVSMDDKGVIRETCGEADDDDVEKGVASPLALLSDIYFVEVLYQPANNKRDRYRGKLQPSFWSNPPQKEIRAAFDAGYVLLPGDYVQDFAKYPSSNAPNDEVSGRTKNWDTETDVAERQRMAHSMCCSFNDLLMQGGQRSFYVKEDTREEPSASQDGRKLCQRTLFTHGGNDACYSCAEDTTACGELKPNIQTTSGKRVCEAICHERIGRGDLVGRGHCWRRCQYSIVKTFPEEDGAKLKIRVWVQPDERMASGEKGGRYDTRCDVCSKHCDG